jgi:hypothetical protein
MERTEARCHAKGMQKQRAKKQLIDALFSALQLFRFCAYLLEPFQTERTVHMQQNPIALDRAGLRALGVRNANSTILRWEKLGSSPGVIA